MEEKSVGVSYTPCGWVSVASYMTFVLSCSFRPHPQTHLLFSKNASFCPFPSYSLCETSQLLSPHTYSRTRTLAQRAEAELYEHLRSSAHAEVLFQASTSTAAPAPGSRSNGNTTGGENNCYPPLPVTDAKSNLMVSLAESTGHGTLTSVPRSGSDPPPAEGVK